MHPAHISHRHKLVGVPLEPALRNLFPEAREVDFAGERHIVIPHGPVETFLLRKHGFDVPAPILSHYDWAGGSPFDVQKKTCAMLTSNTRAYVLNGMGTGKTKAALWSWHYLKGNGLAKRALVLAPLSTLKFTWQREVFNTLPGVSTAVLHGTRAKRIQALNEGADINVLNHDGLKVMLKEIEPLVDAGEFDTLIIDELAAYRNGGAQRTKTLRKFAAKFRWVWGMTGAPIPNCPTDAWAQCSIVTPDTVPKYYSRFRDELMIKVSQFKWTPKRDAVDRAFDAMQPAVRYTLSDILELPECVERTLDIEMGPKQAKIYKELTDTCYSAVQNGEITAANAGAVMQKLLQVATGWVYTADGTVVALDNDKRVEALVDAINATDRKVLVFAPFKHNLTGISAALTSEGIEHATVSGDTSANERSNIFHLFQNTNKYRVIAAHPTCLAHGITLTAADTIIWFAPITSLETYDQANARIRRVGQTHKQLVLHLQSTKVEQRIYTLLQQKQKVQAKLLELFEGASE